MSERHFERPGNAGPKPQCREKGGGEAQIIFHKKSADDAGEPGNTGSHVDHERGEIRKLEVAGEFQDIAVDPAGYGSHHIGVTGKGTNTFIFSFSVTRTGQAFASSAVAR